MKLISQTVRTDSPYYGAARALRERLLRKPLGLTLMPADTARDEASLHCVLRHGETVIATAMVTPEADRARIGQVVVDERYQGQGFGTALMESAESAVTMLGLSRCYLEARDVVEPFYRNRSYVPTGEPFLKLGILHHPMEKRLVPPQP